jgi:hypothetical protein
MFKNLWFLTRAVFSAALALRVNQKSLEDYFAGCLCELRNRRMLRRRQAKFFHRFLLPLRTLYQRRQI